MDKTASHSLTTDAPAKAANAARPIQHQTALSGKEWVASIGISLVAGLLSAAHYINKEFYDDIKSWKGIEELRNTRDSKLEGISTAKNPKTFTAIYKEAREIERNYTKDFHDKIKVMRDIEMGGWRGMTIGTAKRVLLSGGHTRVAAAFSMATVSAIAVGAILSLKNRKLISELGEASEENSQSR
ncbi:MAG: hypothetical protein LW853_00970 [Rickettsiales bacterium]|jgi:hypothetical protein|nr:hypothetical protein [Rickettsiales bacterium]